MNNQEQTHASKVERINHIIDLSKHYRDQLAAMADEFAGLHDVEPGSHDHDDLTGCILDGEAYESVMKRIISRRAKCAAEEADDFGL